MADILHDVGLGSGLFFDILCGFDVFSNLFGGGRKCPRQCRPGSMVLMGAYSQRCV